MARVRGGKAEGGRVRGMASTVGHLVECRLGPTGLSRAGSLPYSSLSCCALNCMQNTSRGVCERETMKYPGRRK